MSFPGTCTVVDELLILHFPNMLSLNDIPLPSGRVRERVGWFGEGGFIGALVGVVSVGGGVGRRPRHSGVRHTKKRLLSAKDLARPVKIPRLCCPGPEPRTWYLPILGILASSDQKARPLFFVRLSSCALKLCRRNVNSLSTLLFDQNQHRLKGAYALVGAMNTLTAVKVLRPRDMRNAE